MKLKNTTDYPRIPDRTIRRMVSFCCKTLGMRVGEIRELAVRNRSDGGISGRIALSSGRIICSVGYVLQHKQGPDCTLLDDGWGGFPVYRRHNASALRHRIVQLLDVLSHEIAHRYCYINKVAKGPRNKIPGHCEKNTQWHADLCMRKFEESRDAYLEEWLREPEPEPKPEPIVSARLQASRTRARKDAELLKNWERKQKLATTKVRKYREKVRRAKRRGLLEDN